MTDTLAPTVEAVPTARQVVTAIPGPKSVALHARRQAAVSAGVSSALPVYIERAHGAIVVDVDGNAFIDLGAGSASRPSVTPVDTVVAAAREQLGTCCTRCSRSPPTRSTCASPNCSPSTPPATSRRRACSSTRARRPSRTASRSPASTPAASASACSTTHITAAPTSTMAMNFKAMPYGLGFGPSPATSTVRPTRTPARRPLGCRRRDTHDLVPREDRRRRRPGLPRRRADPGRGRLHRPGRRLPPRVAGVVHGQRRRLHRRRDPERHGPHRHVLRQRALRLVPDMVLSAKGIAGGLPLAGVTGRAEIMDASQPGGLGGTFGGNPVACAAAIAVFEHIERHDLLGEAARIEKTLKPALLGPAGEVPDHRRGARDRRHDRRRIRRPRHARAPRRRARCDRGLRGAAGRAVLTAGTYGNVVRFLPSLAITDAQLLDAGRRHRRRAGDALTASLAAMLGGWTDSVELAVLDAIAARWSRAISARQCFWMPTASILDVARRPDGADLSALGREAAAGDRRPRHRPRAGAASELVLAAASHAGHPAHVAVVERMLAARGLDEAPCSARSTGRSTEQPGTPRTGPRRITMNCSGKHAAFLAASVHSGWTHRGLPRPGPRRCSARWPRPSPSTRAKPPPTGASTAATPRPR